jgi:delta 1-pyrroline-5-carboxylate dehydrogenase
LYCKQFCVILIANEKRAPDRSERQEEIQRLEERAMEQNNTRRKDYGLYIDGRYTEPRGQERLPVINPATGETWATISDASAQDVDQAVDAARGCFASTWSATSPGTRARLLSRLAECIERRSAELAEIEVRDNGKL